MSDISTKQFLKEFEKAVNTIGGIPEASNYWNVSESFIRSVKNGVHLPGNKILKAMNLKPVKHIKYRYERIDPKTSSAG